MSRVKLLYFLFGKRNKPLYVNGNNILEADGNYKKIGGQPAHLETDPEGWHDALVKYARNWKWGGLFREMTVPMTFRNDGAKIVNDVFVRESIEGFLQVGIAKLDQFNLPYNYYSWFLNELNFLKFKKDRNGITIEALEGGLSKYLKAHEGTKFQVPIDEDLEHVSVMMDGMELENSALWSILDGYSLTPFYSYDCHVVNTELVNKEIQDIGGVFTAQRTKVAAGNNNAGIRATGQYIFKATTDGLLHLEWDFKVNILYDLSLGITQNPGNTAAIVLRKIKTDNTSIPPNNQLLILTVPNAMMNGTTWHVQGSGDLPMQKDDELYMFGFTTVHGNGGDAQTKFTYDGSTEPFLKMSYTYRHPISITPGHRPLRLAQLIVDQMTGNPGGYTVKSNFLTALEDSIVVTSGNALRNLNIQPTYITTSITDYFRSFDSRYGIGLGVKGKELIIEEIPHFFQNVVIHDCGEVKNCSLVPAEDLFFNTISNGYSAQEYKEINGLYEFNQGQQWKTPITRVTKDLDKKSPYRADPFGIELLRINFGDQKTTDNKADSESFMLNVRPQYNSFNAHITFTNSYNLMLIYGAAARINDFKLGVRFQILGSTDNNHIFTSAGAGTANGVDLIVGAFAPPSPGGILLVPEDNPNVTVKFLTYVLNRPAYTSVDGLLHSASAFNIELSPKRGLLANGRWIKSVLHKQDGSSLTLASADKNTDLKTVMGGITISERDPVPVNDLGDRLFLPYYFKFETESPVNLLEIMEVNPYGKIKFTVEGEVFYGFLMDGGLKPSTNDVQQWTLLSAPENNLSKFLKR